MKRILIFMLAVLVIPFGVILAGCSNNAEEAVIEEAIESQLESSSIDSESVGGETLPAEESKEHYLIINYHLNGGLIYDYNGIIDNGYFYEMDDEHFSQRIPASANSGEAYEILEKGGLIDPYYYRTEKNNGNDEEKIIIRVRHGEFTDNIKGKGEFDDEVLMSTFMNTKSDASGKWVSTSNAGWSEDLSPMSNILKCSGHDENELEKGDVTIDLYYIWTKPICVEIGNTHRYCKLSYWNNDLYDGDFKEGFKVQLYNSSYCDANAKPNRNYYLLDNNNYTNSKDYVFDSIVGLISCYQDDSKKVIIKVDYDFSANE